MAEADTYWQQIGHPQRQSFRDAAHAALAEERHSSKGAPPFGFWDQVEKGLLRFRHACPGAEP